MRTLTPRASLRLAFLLAALSVPLVAQRSRDRGDAQAGARWAPDGVHVVYRGEWYDAASWQRVERAAARGERAEDTAADARARAALSELGGKKLAPEILTGDRERSTLPRQPIENPGLRATADGDAGAIVAGGELWVWREGGEPRKVKEGLAGIRHFEIAPDGSAVSYIDRFDLHIVHTADGKTHRLSDDGSEDLFYGELDWVYQEEVYGRGEFQANWWSPASDHLAFLRIDEAGVDTFTVVDHRPDQLGIELLKYPKAGRTNPRASLHVARASDGRRVAVDLGGYRPQDEILLVHVGWTPSGDRAVLMVQNREQTWLDLVFVDPETGAAQLVLRETCADGWVNRPPLPRWLADGTFLWESERTGYKHLYRYARDGTLVATVSHGEWEVRDIVRLDEQGGWIAFYGTTPEYAIGQNAYRAALDGKSLVRLTKGRGHHSISLNGDGSLVLDSFSSMVNPGEQWLRRADGSDVRAIQEPRDPGDRTLPQWQQIKARDGETLDVVYTLPDGFDPSRRYPVWIETYSGPDAPTVRDVWRPSRAADWFVGLQVNVRSASGRGMKFTKTCYRHFGVQELRDLEDAVDWLCGNHAWADAARVGISGWSYGGFMAAYALTHSTKFKCGIAGAGVYAWQLYDTIYTERYMALPQNNPDGYRLSSCVDAAGDLTGHLLIVHGTIDDNVHMQNALQFVDALQKAGKLDFEFMLYPGARHGVRSPHLGALREKFMRQNL
jgi:dipeptidyl-peptidase-4